MGKRGLLQNQDKVCRWIFCLRDNIQRRLRIRNKCGSMITWVSTGKRVICCCTITQRKDWTEHVDSRRRHLWLTKNVKDDVKDWCGFMDQGGESYRSKAIRDLFEKEFGYEMRVTGTGAHHQNGLVERANQIMDKAIRAMLIGAGLPVKFWPYAFRHFLRIKNSALPR